MNRRSFAKSAASLAAVAILPALAAKPRPLTQEEIDARIASKRWIDVYVDGQKQQCVMQTDVNRGAVKLAELDDNGECFMRVRPGGDPDNDEDYEFASRWIYGRVECYPKH